MTFKLQGFQEAVVSVRSFEPLKKIFCEYGQWIVTHEGPIDPQLMTQWQLPDSCTGEECVLKNRDCESGFLRMLRFQGVEQKQMRANDQSWDTGGIFDFNVRIQSMEKAYSALMAQNWRGSSDPVKFMLGSSTVIEWIVVGPDQLRFALIERVDPPLQGWDHMQPFSQVFNSTQIVSDLSRSLNFYQTILGFKLILTSGNLNESAGPNVLGLPWNRAHSEKYELAILQPDGEMRGSIELLQYQELQGCDFSQHNHPPHLGMLTLRFPVTNIKDFYQHLSAYNVDVCLPPCDIMLAPYGRCALLAINTPDGARLEFFEKIN